MCRFSPGSAGSPEKKQKHHGLPGEQPEGMFQQHGTWASHDTFHLISYHLQDWNTMHITKYFLHFSR